MPITFMVMLFKFLPTGGFKWINPTKFDLSKYRGDSSESSV